MNIFDRPKTFFLFCHRFIIIIRDKGNEVELSKNILNYDNRYLNHFVHDIPRPLLKSLVWLQRTLLPLTKSVDNFTKHHLGNFYS